MTRGGKILAGILAASVLLPAALVAAVATFDWNRARPLINEKASQALGRPFAIRGELRVDWARRADESGWRAWVPWPHVQAHDIVVGNPPWAEGDFAVVRRAGFALAPVPLLARRIRIPGIHVSGPAIQLRREADGKANWQFDLPESGPHPSAWQLDVGTVGFDRVRISLQDAVLDAAVDIAVEPLGAPISLAQVLGAAGQAAAAPSAPGDYAFGWQIDGRYQGMPVRGEGKVGGLLALQGGAPFPVQADVQAGRTRASVAGTLTDPLDLAALDLKLALSGRTLSDLYPLTGITLPDTPPYATDGHLRARLGTEGSTFDYQGFTGRVGKSDLRGDLRYVSGPDRPKLTGKLVSDQLRLADLGPLVGAGAAGQDADAGRAAKPRQRPGKVLPVQAFRTTRWRAMDANVAFDGKRIVHSRRLPLRDVSGHLVLDDGVLTLDPLRFGVAGGRLDAALRLDGARSPMQGRARLAARGFKLKELLPDFEPMQTSLGEINGDAALAGSGNSVAALLASADGELKVLINDGAISRGLTEIAGLNVANYVVTKLFGDDEVVINCAAADMALDHGVMTPRLAVFDTENVLVEVSGTVDFGKESLDLDIRPHSKGIRIISLRSPLYVRGSFADPQAGVQPGPLIARGAGMVLLGALLTPAAGLLALIAPGADDKDNPCATLLRQMRREPAAGGR